MSGSGFVWNLPYAYAKDGGAYAAAIVEWHLPDRCGGSVTTAGYAPDPEIIRQLAGTASEELGDLARTGKLKDSMGMYRGLKGIYRVTITDGGPSSRSDYLLAYRSSGSYRPALRPGTVYRFWDGSRAAPRRSYRELTRYIDAPDAHVITSLGTGESLNLRDPRIRRRLGLDRPVVVWDYHQIYS